MVMLWSCYGHVMVTSNLKVIVIIMMLLSWYIFGDAGHHQAMLDLELKVSSRGSLDGLNRESLPPYSYSWLLRSNPNHVHSDVSHPPDSP